MLSNRLYIIGLHLLFFTYHVSTHVIISANVDDVNRIARKFFTSWAEQISNYVGKVVDYGRSKAVKNAIEKISADDDNNYRNRKDSSEEKGEEDENENEHESLSIYIKKPILKKGHDPYILSDTQQINLYDDSKPSKESKSDDEMDDSGDTVTKEPDRYTKGAMQVESREHSDGEIPSIFKRNHKSMYRSLNAPEIEINTKSENNRDESGMSLMSIEYGHKSKNEENINKAHGENNIKNNLDEFDVEDSTYSKLILRDLPNISEEIVK